MSSECSEAAPSSPPPLPHNTDHGMYQNFAPPCKVVGVADDKAAGHSTAGVKLMLVMGCVEANPGMPQQQPQAQNAGRNILAPTHGMRVDSFDSIIFGVVGWMLLFAHATGTSDLPDDEVHCAMYLFARSTFGHYLDIAFSNNTEVRCCLCGYQLGPYTWITAHVYIRQPQLMGFVLSCKKCNQSSEYKGTEASKQHLASAAGWNTPWSTGIDELDVVIWSHQLNARERKRLRKLFRKFKGFAFDDAVAQAGPSNNGKKYRAFINRRRDNHDDAFNNATPNYGRYVAEAEAEAEERRKLKRRKRRGNKNMDK